MFVYILSYVLEYADATAQLLLLDVQYTQSHPFSLRYSKHNILISLITHNNSLSNNITLSQTELTMCLSFTREQICTG